MTVANVWSGRGGMLFVTVGLLQLPMDITTMGAAVDGSTTGGMVDVVCIEGGGHGFGLRGSEIIIMSTQVGLDIMHEEMLCQEIII